jgi:hypothetical protein
LATSREGLSVRGEQIIAVPSLDVPDDTTRPEMVAACEAVRLFVDRAQGVKATFVVDGSNAEAVALRGKSLVVGTKSRQLKLYDANTGSLRKTISARGSRQPRSLDVQGNIVIYTTGSAGALHAANLSTGADHVMAEPNGGVEFAHLDSAGLVYAGNGSGTNYGKGTLVFEPLARIKASVG